MLSADKWKRIEALFERVESAPEEDRARLVYESGEDDSVRWEVLKMLGAARDGGLLEVDLRARPRSAYQPGDTLAGGRFRIEEKIAEGGMGEVYRATDTELNIPIALKTVHRVFAHDEAVLERFKQEVQLARAINHPNVCRIYDLERNTGGQGELFLTMELLDGETLRAFLDREGRTSEAEAYRIVAPALDALQASHDRGILHRDLKPSNIQLANGGARVVVTDFGLATTAIETATGEGISAGTPAYMAPEQFERTRATAATDVYAAATVLYEMVCGRLPFTGKTPADMREQKALNQAVPARQLAPAITGRLESALHKALQADPAKRFASVAEFHAAIRPRSWKYVWGAIGIAAAIAAITSGIWWLGRPKSEALPAPRKLTSDTGITVDPTLSADGRLIVYSSDRGANGVRSIWRMREGSSVPEQLTFDEFDSYEPHLSADGSRIVYRSERDGGGLYAMLADGGEAKRIANGGRRPRFSPDGQWVLYMHQPATATQYKQVYAVRSQGGNPIHVTAGFRDAHNPIWSEDGTQVLFCGTKTSGVPSEEHDWWAVPFLTGGVPRKTGMRTALEDLARSGGALGDAEQLGAWQGGFVYFVSNMAEASSLWRVRYREQASSPLEPPQRITNSASRDQDPAVGGGRVVYASGSSNIDVWMQELNPATGAAQGEPKRLTETTDFEVSPSADPAGKTLAMARVTTGGGSEIRLLNWETERDSRVFSEAGENAAQPLFSRDGLWVAYRVFEKPKLRIWAKHRATGERRLICEDCGYPTDWSPDQQYLLYEPGADPAFIGRLDVAANRWLEWVRHPHLSLRDGRFSPDGRWIAFTAEVSKDERSVFVAPNESQTGDALWIPLSESGSVDFLPAWSRDGAIVYFVSGRDGFRCIWGRRLDPVTRRAVGKAFHVQHFHRARRSLMRNVNVSAVRIGLKAQQDRLFFAMDEVTGNLWTVDVPK